MLGLPADCDIAPSACRCLFRCDLFEESRTPVVCVARRCRSVVSARSRPLVPPPQKKLFHQMISFVAAPTRLKITPDCKQEPRSEFSVMKEGNGPPISSSATAAQWRLELVSS